MHADAVELLAALVFAQLALGHGALEVGPDARAARFRARDFRLVQPHGVAGGGHHLGDAVAHQARAADEDFRFAIRP